MTLPNTALLKRSLMIDARLWTTYAFRGGMALIVLLFMANFLTSNVTAAGLTFFSVITRINLIFITLLGCSIFSDVITEEKEVNSLNLLLMTGLSPLIMLLSKSTSKFWIGVCLLLVQLPFTLLSVTLGGISIFQILAVYVAVLVYIFMICNISLFASVVSNRTGQAMTLSFLLLLVLLVCSWIIPVNPFSRVNDILNTGYAGKLIDWQFYISLIIGVICFLTSWLLFNRFSRESVTGGPGRILVGTNQSKLPVSRISRVWNDAIKWKVFYFASGGKAGLYLRIIMLSLFALGAIFFNYAVGIDLRVAAICIIISGALITLIDVGFIIASSFKQETLWKTWSVLFILPIDSEDLLRNKINGILQCLVPEFIYIVTGILLFLASSGGKGIIILVFTVPLALLSFRFYLYMSIYFSLRFKYAGAVMAFLTYMLIITVFGCIGILVFLIAPTILKKRIMERIRELSTT